MRFLKFVVVLWLIASSATYSDVIKKSKNRICHDRNSPYYERIIDFTIHDTIEDCVDTGGKIYSTYRKETGGELNYERDKFRHWIDDDRDCLNTRHELLLKTSRKVVKMNESGCIVIYGEWLDSYTGEIHYRSSDVDIDHIVPLEWAWRHGAHQWSNERRETFANDFDNLAIVNDSVNSRKGSKSPLEWLPPNSDYVCEYIDRFLFLIDKYVLHLSDDEKVEFYRLKERTCDDLLFLFKKNKDLYTWKKTIFL